MFEDIVGKFLEVFEGEKPCLVSRASGRVELIGGHTDYNEGFVIASAIDCSFWVAASKGQDNKICMYSDLMKQKYEFELSADVKPDQEVKWANYGIAVAAGRWSCWGESVYKRRCSGWGGP